MIARPWRTFARLFTGSRRLLAISLAVSIAQSVLLVPIALIIRHAFDHLIPDGDKGALLWSGAAILGLYLASAGLALLGRYTVVRANKEAIARLRISLLERIYTLPRAHFDRSDLGTLHSTIVQDSERLDLMTYALVGSLLPAAITCIGLVAVLAALNIALLALLLAVMPILMILGRVLAHAARRHTRDFQLAFDVFSKRVQFTLRAMTMTKAHGAEELELSRRRAEIEEVARTSGAMQWQQNVYTLVQGSVAAIAGVIVLVAGGAAVADHSISLGTLLSFYAGIALLRGQATSVLVAMPVVISGRESMERLQEILDLTEPQPYEGTRRIDFHGGVTLEDVEFGYEDVPVLNGVSLRISPGEQVALIGPNGAGKSTIVSLVLALYRPDSGRLLMDGVPLDELDVVELRRRIGVILQDPIIFRGTVRENIAYGRPDVSDADLRAAAELAGAAGFVERLADGYDTDVGDEGVLLSAGQRQRIAIARSLLSKPALLILDEPTSHLDQRGTEMLVANLRDLEGAPAVLMISHDLVVADQADRVYLVRD
ncbi:MAG TPA: ABC transporter ATP-binding protein, partial [Thermoleophilaceae bacterium]